MAMVYFEGALTVSMRFRSKCRPCYYGMGSRLGLRFALSIFFFKYLIYICKESISCIMIIVTFSFWIIWTRVSSTLLSYSSF